MARYTLHQDAILEGNRDEAAGVLVWKISSSTVLATSDDRDGVVRDAKAWLYDNPFASLVLTDGTEVVQRLSLEKVQTRVSELGAQVDMAEMMGIAHGVLLVMFIVASVFTDYGIVGYLSVPVVNGLYHVLSRTGSRNYIEALWLAFPVNLAWLIFAAGG